MPKGNNEKYKRIEGGCTFPYDVISGLDNRRDLCTRVEFNGTRFAFKDAVKARFIPSPIYEKHAWQHKRGTFTYAEGSEVLNIGDIVVFADRRNRAIKSICKDIGHVTDKSPIPNPKMIVTEVCDITNVVNLTVVLDGYIGSKVPPQPIPNTYWFHKNTKSFFHLTDDGLLIISEGWEPSNFKLYAKG
tara:strand:+ start:660 stop:1223 length:564 start_codon:yes stop_codon:yes gene_type:complete